MSLELLKALNEADWDNILPIAYAHALSLAERYAWQSGNPENLFEGMQPADIVDHVIDDLFKGERNWDRERVDLLSWIKYNTKSEISHLVQRVGHQRTSYLGALEEREGSTDRLEYVALQQDARENAGQLTPEQILIREEVQADHDSNWQDKFAALELVCESDEKLMSILNAVRSGFDPKPQVIADALNVPVEDVYNRMKRLRRKANRIKEAP